MKIIMIILVTILCIDTTINANNKMELTKRQQIFIEIAAYEAKGDMSRLYDTMCNGLEQNVSLSEIKEVLSHLYAYTGFPRALNGFEVLHRIVSEKKLDAMTDEYTLPDDFNALEEGTKKQIKLCGGEHFNYNFDKRIDYYLKAHLFGDVFANPILSDTDRELVTISAVSALKGSESQLTAHVNGAVNMGLYRQQIQLIAEHLQSNVGEVESYRLRKVLAAEYGTDFDECKVVDFNVWPKGNLNILYAKYFIGKSYLAPLNVEQGGPVNVTFEPRCRNNWHIHHDCVQVLICVAGEGWYQEFGKKAVKMVEGSVITIPSGIKHWHGAAKDSWFQHLTYNTMSGKDASNEWLEPVDDDFYDKLK